MSIKIDVNFDSRILNISSIVGNIKSNLNKSLKESAIVIKNNIKAELRSPNKSGTLVTTFAAGKTSALGASRYGRRSRRYSERRSAKGESLARDTGASEQLIASSLKNNSQLEVGFLENPHGFEYIKYQELEQDRPTVKKAVENSLKEIERIFDKNLTPK